MPTFRGKRFTNASLMGLAHIDTMRSIALYETAVTDDGLVAFAQRARRLKQFHISSMHLTDRGLGAILRHCPIENLHVHDAVGVTDASAALIAPHDLITELYLNGSSITDAATQYLVGLGRMWSFCARDSAIGDKGLTQLGRLPALKLIDLSRSNICGDGLQSLRGLENLDIFLEGCPITDNELASSLSKMSRLRGLSISYADISDLGLTDIQSCVNLLDIRLDCTAISDATVERLAEMPHLEVIYLRGTRVSREAIELLWQRIPDIHVYSDLIRPS